MELPANWQPGDQALPVNLEDKMDFLGLDVTTEEEKEERSGYMGEPKVEQERVVLGAGASSQVIDFISLFNHIVRDLAGPRDLSFFLQGL